MIFMKLLIFVILLYTISTTQFKINKFTELIQIWREAIRKDSRFKEWKFLFEDYDIPKNDCFAQCQYPIFQFKNYDSENETHPIVFLVGTFHGNQKLGSHIITYSIPYLIGKHIIFFPVANPSGYTHNQREQFPSQIDPNRDFSYNVSPDVSCMRGITSRIMDFIFRTWKIDLTVTFHAGGEQLTWNWGSYNHLNHKTQDDIISQSIGSSLQLYGGQNKMIGMNKFKIGNMNQVIYPTHGSFQDWAYASSWQQEAVSKCLNFNYKPYPQNMTTGLVFLIQSGPQDRFLKNLGSSEGLQLNPDAYSFSNGYITRGIRVIKKLLQIVYPQLLFKRTIDHLVIQSIGCSEVNLLITINDIIQTRKFKGSMNDTPTPILIKFEQLKLTGESELFISYKMKCDPKWENKGKSIFGKGRQYNKSMKTKVSELQYYIKQKEEIEYLQNYTLFEYAMFGFGILFGLSIIFIVIYLVYKQFKKVNNVRPIKNLTTTEHEIVQTELNYLHQNRKKNRSIRNPTTTARELVQNDHTLQQNRNVI